jgi:hypothetical protein
LLVATRLLFGCDAVQSVHQDLKRTWERQKQSDGSPYQRAGIRSKAVAWNFLFSLFFSFLFFSSFLFPSKTGVCAQVTLG